MNGDSPLSISYSQRKYLKIMRLKYYEILSKSFPEKNFLENIRLFGQNYD